MGGSGFKGNEFAFRHCELQVVLWDNQQEVWSGAYGIQGIFGRYVEKIDGDYNNVVGLPVSKILYILKVM